MTATRPGPSTKPTLEDVHPAADNPYSYLIAKRTVKRPDGLAVDQWRAECTCGRRTDWHKTPNLARSFGRSHHQHPIDPDFAA